MARPRAADVAPASAGLERRTVAEDAPHAEQVVHARVGAVSSLEHVSDDARVGEGTREVERERGVGGCEMFRQLGLRDTGLEDRVAESVARLDDPTHAREVDDDAPVNHWE